MALPDEHLSYPHRSYGMDHDHYQWSQLAQRKPIQWPQGKKLALWINIPLQFFSIRSAR